jgi:hypothetical protein
MYSRQQPSPEYEKLVALCTQMHAQGYFSGQGCFKCRKQIRALVKETGSKTLLDYGCGKGLQFREGDAKKLHAKLKVYCDSWQEALGVDSILGYDPACEPYAALPVGQYDGCYCIDVLEHIPDADVHWILDEIFSYARKFVFLTIATVPAKKTLPDGRNAHITLREPGWWLGLCEQTARQYPGIRWQLELENGESMS